MTSIQQPRVPAAIDRALRNFRTNLDSKEKADFGHVHTEAELMALIDSLEAEQAARGCIRNMTRIMPFVNGLSQYARVIEVFVQAKPDILSFIWGPIKLLLQLASNFVDSFDKFLDACKRIEDNLPRFIRFASIFQYSDQIQNIIGILYEDILEFYCRTLKFFRRRAWHMFFSLAWRDFESRFGYIVDNIRRHQTLIDNEVSAQDIEESHKARELAKEHLEEYIREKETKRKKACAEWLSPADVDTAKDNASRTKTPGTSEWLLKSWEVDNWLGGNNGVDTIWLCGIPGAGKTVLSSTAIDHLETIRDGASSSVASVLYFFCSYKRPDLNTCLSILRTFVYQIILQDEQLMSSVYEEYIASPHSITVLKCKKMLNHLLGSGSPNGAGRTFILIDGLDELPEAERAEFLPIVKQMMNNTALKIFIASQDLLDIRKVLSKHCTCISVGDKNKRDIRKYIERATEELVEELDLDEVAPDMAGRIIESLTARAGGMFLWARLVINGLLSIATIQQIEDTLENLPVGLDQTLYERILDRIRSLSPEERDLAVALLQWMACSTRIMTLRELQLAVSIRPDHTSTEMKNRPLLARLRSTCGPIIEVVGEDTMAFVHFSAREYLLSNHSGPFIDRAAAQLNIAIVSLTYFGFRCFDQEITQDEVVRLVFQGDVQLLEYMQSSWIRHVCEAYNSSNNFAQLALLSTLLRQNIINKHFTKAAWPDDQTFEEGSGIAVSLAVQNHGRMPPDISSGLLKILQYREKVRQTLRSPEVLEKWCDENDPLDIRKASRKLLSTMEDILEGRIEVSGEPDAAERLRKLYGQKLFKCHNQICAIFSAEGFESAAQRKQHEDKHDFPYKCLAAENCFYKEIGFSSKQQLQRHTRDCHKNLFLTQKKVARNLEVLVRTIRRPRTTSELVIRQPAHDAGTSKKAIMGTQPELQPPSSISKAHKSAWDTLKNAPQYRELDDYVSTTSPTVLPKPVPAVSLEHRSSTKIANAYSGGTNSPRSFFDDDDTIILDENIVGDYNFYSTLDISSMDRRRGSVLDTNAIFSPSANWDFDHDMGMTGGPADDSMPVPAAIYEHSEVTNNPFIKLEQAQPVYAQHNWSSNSGASDSMPVTDATFERSNETNNPFIRPEQAQPGYAQHNWSSNSGALDSMPVPAAALERSNGTNNPFLRLEQAQPGYAEQHDWSLNSGASGAGTPTTFDISALNRA